MSGELWLGEGFTQYYGPLALSRARAGGSAVDTVGGVHGARGGGPVHAGPRRPIREEMSRMAHVHRRRPTGDRTNWSNTYISYYPFGGAIALALDLSLRGRSDGRVTLDDFMRAMWRVHGKPGGAPEGYVSRPYTLDDAEKRLAEVSGDAAFARDFFARYVHGREVPDYARLLQPAGLLLRKTAPGRSWWGDVSLESGEGVRLATAPLANTPLYRAGLDAGDHIRRLAGERVSSRDQALAILRRHRPGDTLPVEFVDRSGGSRTGSIVVGEDPRVDVVPVEAAGGRVTAEQRAFRRAWLGGP